jgi:addiction module RelE/StbE family toxin
MHVRFQDTAEADLVAIKRYIEPESPKGLERVLTAIFTIAEQLESFPLMGRVGEVEGTREIIVPRTPFRLIYTLDDPHFIDIVRVLHGARQYPPPTP